MGYDFRLDSLLPWSDFEQIGCNLEVVISSKFRLIINSSFQGHLKKLNPQQELRHLHIG